MTENKLIDRNKQLLNKGVFLVVLCLASLSSFAQRDRGATYRDNHDEWPYYFGMTLAYNTSFLAATKSKQFMQTDTVLSVLPGAAGGIGLGLIGTLRLNDYFQLRFNPQLIIGGSRSFTYTVKYPDLTEKIEKKVLPSTIVSFPLSFKFNSDRLKNFRTYLLAGVKADIDLASNSAARNAEDLVKLKKSDYGYEVGIGFNFYTRFVTLSPEIKISNGLSNIHSRDPNLKYSNVLEKLQSRMVVFSLHLED